MQLISRTPPQIVRRLSGKCHANNVRQIIVIHPDFCLVVSSHVPSALMALVAGCRVRQVS